LSHFKLSSNVIVPLHGITKDPESGDFMLIIEYMPGGDLNHFLKNKNIILTWMECYSLLISIAAALLTIYRNGLVHKDLHPGNILTHEHHWRISDLGLCGPANACKDDEYSNRTIAGVMPYVAPEVLKYKIYTYAADIYSFGIIMWQITIRSKPFWGCLHDISLARDICNSKRSEISSGLSDDYEKIMKRCWDNDSLR